MTARSSSFAATTRSSPLELFLPDGAAANSLVLGSGCPQTLLREGQATDAPADLVVLAPDGQESRSARWLEDASRSASERLARDGLVYLLAPPLARARLRRLLLARGLAIGPSVAHIPDWEASRLLVPLDGESVRHAVSGVADAPRWKRGLAAAGALGPVRAIAGRLYPKAGLVARRPGGRPLFDWLGRLAGKDGTPRGIVIGTSWRGSGGSIRLHCAPRLVVKTGLTRSVAEAVADEAAALERLGTLAREAGAHVPELLALGQVAGRPVLLETAIHGRSAAALLTAEPGRLSDVLERIADWLERWSLLTKTTRALERDDLERLVLVPAALLSPQIASGYEGWLADRCELLVGSPAPVVAAHNDLTMWNVAVGEDGIGVFDWETARDNSLPLVDLYYAIVDAVAATERYADRPRAFASCFSPGGAHAPLTAALAKRLQATVGGSPDIAELSLHACWVGHAANEHRAATRDAPRPFLEIMRTLAAWTAT